MFKKSKNKSHTILSIQKLILTAVLLLSMTGSSFKRIEAESANNKEVLNFQEVSVHDPSIIKVEDTYYVFGTHVSGAKSKDLKNWTYFVNLDVKNNTLFGNIEENLKESFEWSGHGDATRPEALGIWAPDVYYNPSYVNDDGSQGAYLMYYSMSSGEHYRSLIGLASSQDIEGPYEYVDTIVYTGFTNVDGKEHWENTDFPEHFPNSTPNHEYFRSDGTYNFDLYPNAIDPGIVDGKNGEIYMTYGSWNGGVYILELDPKSGLPIRPDNYHEGVGPNDGDSYFGVKISGGYYTTGEGPYIVYDEASDYYHYYLTYGFLVQDSDYNMRFFRSKDIYGPYEDMKGNIPLHDSNFDVSSYGNKLMGSFEFLKEQSLAEDAGYFGYRVPGHNSIYFDEESGKTFNIFHTRFKEKGEGHEVRVHQVLFDEDGWPLMVPQRYNGEEVISDNSIDVSGTLLLVNQEEDISLRSKQSYAIALDPDGKVQGKHSGEWNFTDGVLNLSLDGNDYRGFVLEQSTPITAWEKDLTYTLIGTSEEVRGQSLLALRISNNIEEEVLVSSNQESELKKKHYFNFDSSLEDKINPNLEGKLVGEKINQAGGELEYANGKFKKAVYLDGKTGIKLPNNLISSESYSVSIWLNPEELNTYSTSFFGASNEASWLSLVPQSGGDSAGNTILWSGEQWYDADTKKQVPVDEWSHLVFSVDKGKVQVYLNGEEVSSGTGFPDLFVGKNANFSLGVNYWDLPFKGKIDELVVYDGRTFTSKEVDDLFKGSMGFVEDEKDTGYGRLLIAGVVATSFLLGAVFYYKKKNKKEKHQS